MGSVRTLLVEADDSAGSTRGKLASARGASFSVERSRTLRSAVSRVRSGDIDVVLLDLDLPDSSGTDSIVRLHKAAPEVPIVVMTDSDDEDLALRSLRAHAEDYLVKGRTDRVLLQRTIRHALERHRLQFDRERSLHSLAKKEARFRNVVATSTEGVVVVSRDGKVLFANPAAARLVGLPVEQLKAEMFGYPFTDAKRREIKVADRFLEVHVVESDWDGAPAWLASVVDITAHKRSQANLREISARVKDRNARLERLASVDPLTEVMNRRGLEAALSIEVQRRSRKGAPLCAVLLDCDDFKRTNDALGHAGGDVVLRELANRLKRSLRPSDHLGRVGGDEFLVLLPDTRFEEAFQVAERLRLSVSQHPLRLPSGPVSVTASLGIEQVPEGTRSIEEVLVRTQMSLQNSKRAGKNRVSTQDGGAAKAAADAEDLVRGLQEPSAFRALRAPILRLADDGILGWEMVARGPAGVFEKPRDFFRLALARNMLTQVDLQCMRTCIRQGRDLSDSSWCHINAFPSTLLETPRETLMDLFVQPDAPQRFCLELSEQHVIGEPALLRDHLHALKDAGIRVAIDDVGFGHSSLETLILLEPDLVKIDQSFVHEALRDPGKQSSLRRMIGVVASLGSDLVAEGVDSREDLEILRDLGVSYGQGALWGLAG
jgi:diguanylate cyclase (GGDEF)-like protein